MTITLIDGSEIILRNQIWLNEFLSQLATAISHHTVVISFAGSRTEVPTTITITRGQDFSGWLAIATEFPEWDVKLV